MPGGLALLVCRVASELVPLPPAGPGTPVPTAQSSGLRLHPPPPAPLLHGSLQQSFGPVASSPWLPVPEQPKSSARSSQKVLLPPGAMSPWPPKPSPHSWLGMWLRFPTAPGSQAPGRRVPPHFPTMLQVPSPEDPAGPRQAAPSGPEPGRRAGCGIREGKGQCSPTKHGWQTWNANTKRPRAL